jgi:carbamoylphosphate synthase large subunit
MGTCPTMIDKAEDREKFSRIIDDLGNSCIYVYIYMYIYVCMYVICEHTYMYRKKHVYT